MVQETLLFLINLNKILYLFFILYLYKINFSLHQTKKRLSLKVVFTFQPCYRGPYDMHRWFRCKPLSNFKV